MEKLYRRGAIALACTLLLTVHASAARMLVPVGKVIGIELSDGCVTVAAIDDVLGADSRAAGLQVGDQILAVDEHTVDSAQDIRHALERSDGTVELHLTRGGRELEITVCPKVTEQGPRLGVYLRQGITGVGTVTWFDPDSGTFGALGHGVNTANGELLPLRRGSVYQATVAGVQKGEAGAPGQLVGALKDQMPVGVLSKNTAQGIFGTSRQGWQGESLAVGSAGEIKPGEAKIRSTVSDGQVREYSVEILKIYPNAGTTGRNMLLRVTDPALLEATGGIVQGMSGSPIIQDGKLVGAVTHVLVNDPTTGYGIFIENMLDAAA